ncbi:hypothetical protein [Actinoplanes sp. NPDC049599]|uniref:hypothetical protein n=1 Tax=Actinoplanes sp. NPDC049599 TaxID=3363903 RepID=UPI0037AFF82D
MSVGMLFVGQVGQLPLLAVLVVGFVVLGSRGKRLGARSVLLARLGLGTLTLGMILGIAWTMLIPTLYSRLDYSVARYSLLFSGLGLITSLLSAAGIALLIAAVVSRESGPPFQDGPFAGGPAAGGAPADAAAGGASFSGQPPPGGQSGPGRHYGAGDQPTGPFPG